MGLTASEAKAYVALTKHGSQTSEETAASLGLALSRAIEALEGLVAKGLVIRRPSGSAAYTPLHPRMALTNLFKACEAQVVR